MASLAFTALQVNHLNMSDINSASNRRDLRKHYKRILNKVRGRALNYSSAGTQHIAVGVFRGYAEGSTFDEKLSKNVTQIHRHTLIVEEVGHTWNLTDEITIITTNTAKSNRDIMPEHENITIAEWCLV